MEGVEVFTIRFKLWQLKKNYANKTGNRRRFESDTKNSIETIESRDQ